MTEPSRVVTVLGGHGNFGGRVAEAIAHEPLCRVRVVGRNDKVGRNFAQRIVAEFQMRSLGDRESIREAIAGSFLVIHAAEPYQGADYPVAELCVEAGIHDERIVERSEGPARPGSASIPARASSSSRSVP